MEYNLQINKKLGREQNFYLIVLCIKFYIIDVNLISKYYIVNDPIDAELSQDVKIWFPWVRINSAFHYSSSYYEILFSLWLKYYCYLLWYNDESFTYLTRRISSIWLYTLIHNLYHVKLHLDGENNKNRCYILTKARWRTDAEMLFFCLWILNKRNINSSYNCIYIF